MKMNSTNSHSATVSRIASGQRASGLADGMSAMNPLLAGGTLCRTTSGLSRSISMGEVQSASGQLGERRSVAPAVQDQAAAPHDERALPAALVMSGD